VSRSATGTTASMISAEGASRISQISNGRSLAQPSRPSAQAFRLLGAHPRLVGLVEQVFSEKLYTHRYKINAKAAFEGDVW
jgi:hypothetical protein